MAELVISGEKIISVNLPEPLPSSEQRGGTVISLDASKGSMFIKESDGSLLSVSVPTSARIIDTGGKSISLKNLPVGAQVQVFGAYNDSAVFVATLVVRVG